MLDDFGQFRCILKSGAICWKDGELHEAIHRPDLAIFDRVGGGDTTRATKAEVEALMKGKSARVKR